MSGEVFSCPDEGSGTGIWWVEAKDAADFLEIHRAASTAKNYHTHSVSSTESKKRWSPWC